MYIVIVSLVYSDLIEDMRKNNDIGSRPELVIFPIWLVLLGGIIYRIFNYPEYIDVYGNVASIILIIIASTRFDRYVKKIFDNDGDK